MNVLGAVHSLYPNQMLNQVTYTMLAQVKPLVPKMTSPDIARHPHREVFPSLVYLPAVLPRAPNKSPAEKIIAS